MNQPFYPCVVLSHQCPGEPESDHFDWLFETSDGTDPHERSLIAFRVAEIPGEQAGLEATRLAAHRRVYLEYEGPISGGRGRVSRVWSGQARVVETAGAIEITVRTHAGAIQKLWRASLVHGDAWRIVRAGDPH